jgi:hypothetical protein
MAMLMITSPLGAICSTGLVGTFSITSFCSRGYLFQQNVPATEDPQFGLVAQITILFFTSIVGRRASQLDGGALSWDFNFNFLAEQI